MGEFTRVICRYCMNVRGYYEACPVCGADEFISPERIAYWIAVAIDPTNPPVVPPEAAEEAIIREVCRGLQ